VVVIDDVMIASRRYRTFVLACPLRNRDTRARSAFFTPVLVSWPARSLLVLCTRYFFTVIPRAFYLPTARVFTPIRHRVFIPQFLARFFLNALFSFLDGLRLLLRGVNSEAQLPGAAALNCSAEPRASMGVSQGRKAPGWRLKKRPSPCASACPRAPAATW
jgi:hypothetical protein